MANVNQNIVEAIKAALILCQVTHQVLFYPYDPEFTHPFHTDRLRWPTLPDNVSAVHSTHALTRTATPDTVTPVDIGSSKMNSNCAQQIYITDVTCRLLANPEIDDTLESSTGESDGDSEYVELP